MMAAGVDSTPNLAATLIDSLISANLGDRRAFDYAARTYSYQDVAALMNRTANMIRGLGVSPGARVLLLLPESPAFVASLLGAIKAGMVPVLGAPADAGALARCIAATRAAAVIVHESRLAACADALAAIANDAVVVVGGDAHGYTAFVEAVRTQASWHSAESVPADAPALAIWDGEHVISISHGEATRWTEGGAGSTPTETACAVRVRTLLRAFAGAEFFALDRS
jgi:acyl-CoA synthetase (AMP-forming)/AMP-acid ligase II